MPDLSPSPSDLGEGIKRCAGGALGLLGLIEDRLPLVLGALARYMDEIERFNPAYGLVKVTGREELAVRHVLDSLAPLEHIVRLLGLNPGEAPPPERPRLADAGSGAGFPGIPLAICLPGVEVTLIERMGRRANFLRNVLAVLGISHAAVEETELERAAPGRFNMVCFRALHPLSPELVRTLGRLVKNPGGGVLAAWKGRHTTAAAELAALPAPAGGSAGEIIPLSVPFLKEERCLTVIPVRG